MRVLSYRVRPRTSSSRSPWRVAVVIGVGRYDHPAIAPVAYADRDAKAVAESLRPAVGFDEITVLADSTDMKPTLKQIRSVLGRLRFGVKPRDTVLIYFAGRGASERDPSRSAPDGLARYLLPRDANPASLRTTALGMAELERMVQKLPARRVVLIVDAGFDSGHGGRAFGHASSPSDDFLHRFARAKGRAVISAGGANEPVLELDDPIRHGALTHALLEALRGGADRDHDGILTVTEVYDFVSMQVPETVGGVQRPRMSGNADAALRIWFGPR